MNTITETNHASKKAGPPPFFGSTLEQVLQFVLPEDVARVSMVCKTWRDELLKKPATETSDEHAPPGVVINSTAMWKHAVINSNPNVIQAIIKTTQSGNKGTDIDFRALAKSGCLGRKREKPKLPKPTFRIQDLLIVVELKQEKVIIDENGEEKVAVESLGAFCKRGSEALLKKNSCGKVDFDLTNGPDIVFEGQNPLCPDTYNGNVVLWEDAKTEFHSSLTTEIRHGGSEEFRQALPFAKAGTKVISELIASVTLVRLDDWRSFILVDDIKMDMDDSGSSYQSWDEEGFDLNKWSDWGQCQSPFARNEAGSIAREVLEARDITGMLTDVNIKFVCLLPTPDASEQPSWLKKCRNSPAAWTVQDADEISQLKKFQFRLNSLSLDMGTFKEGDEDVDDFDVGEFPDPRGFLLLLEGLDWK